MNPTLVIITGASTGIGRSLVNALRDDPLFIVMIARRPTDDLLKSFDLQGAALQVDLADSSRLENHWLNQVLPILPKEINRAVLVNNAGMVEPVGPVGTLDSFRLQRSLALNLVAPMLLDNLFIRDIHASDKRIVHVSSGAALHAYGGWAAYCSGKAGMKMLSDTVALESSEFNTTVKSMSFAPGIVSTPMQEVLRSVPQSKFHQVQKFIDFHRHGDLLPPEVPARYIRRLILDEVFPDQTFVDIRDIKSD